MTQFIFTVSINHIIQEQLPPAVFRYKGWWSFRKVISYVFTYTILHCCYDQFQEFWDRSDGNHWQEIIPCKFIFKLLASGCVLLTIFSRLYPEIIPHMGNAARNSHVEEHCTMLVPSVKHLRKQMWFQQIWNKRTYGIFHFPKKHTTGTWFYRLQVQTSSSKLSLKLMYP